MITANRIASAFNETWQVRVTLLPGADPTVSHVDWWRTVVGRDPSNESLNRGGPTGPNLRLTGIPGQNLQGVEASLLLDITNERVDWVLIPRIEFGSLPSIRTLGPVANALDFLVDTIGPWLSTLQIDVQRLGIAAVLAGPITDSTQAIRAILGYIPSVRIDPASSKDLLFSVNRQLPSRTIRSTTINRIGRWGVSAVGTEAFPISMSAGDNVMVFPGPTGPQDSTGTPSNYRPRLDVDVNIAMRSLASEERAPLLAELRDITSNIIASGDTNSAG